MVPKNNQIYLYLISGRIPVKAFDCRFEPGMRLFHPLCTRHHKQSGFWRLVWKGILCKRWYCCVDTYHGIYVRSDLRCSLDMHCREQNSTRHFVEKRNQMGKWPILFFPKSYPRFESYENMKRSCLVMNMVLQLQRNKLVISRDASPWGLCGIVCWYI